MQDSLDIASFQGVTLYHSQQQCPGQKEIGGLISGGGQRTPSNTANRSDWRGIIVLEDNTVLVVLFCSWVALGVDS